MTVLNPQIRQEYTSRINKVFDYIEKNLEKQFTLDELAAASNFSKFHFHRIFLALVGETPFRFILRVRLEKAASYLIMNPKDSLSDIALRCGFSDIAIFSRNFRTYFNMSATQYRKNKNENSNLSQINSKIQQVIENPSIYFCFETNTIKWRTNMEINKSVEVKPLPRMTLAYIRHIGPYKGDDKLFEELWKRMMSWAGPRGLLANKDLKSLAIYHDDPNITDEEKLRLSICITVPPETKVDGEIGKMEIDAADYVVARFEINATEFEKAWTWVYGTWFPSSGYQPDDKPCFELYSEEPEDGIFKVDICIPVKPL